MTIDIGTNVPIGSKFTKTWQLGNTGDCNWHGYSIAFVSGDRMGAPDSAPIEDTPPKTIINVSMDLVAPVSAGSFTGVFELRDSASKPLGIGNGVTLSVKNTVGDATTPTPLAAPARSRPPVALSLCRARPQTANT